MLKLHSQLKDLPLMSLREGRPIGRLSEPIIDPDTGRLLAYRLSGARLGGKDLIITADDVREVGSDLAICDSSDALTEASEIIKVAEIDRAGIKILGAKVRTESGRGLGRVKDFAVDVVLHHLERLNVSDLLSRELIISRPQIVSIDRGGVVVRDLTTVAEAPIPPLPAEG